MANENEVSIEYKNLFLPSIGKLGEELYLNEEFADFYFIFESNDKLIERVPAHKFPLSASDVFRTMFNGNWVEKIDAEIVDASPQAFRKFLQFFYLENIKLNDETVAEVMYLGKKYNVTECVDLCRTFLENTCNNDNICTIFGLAINLDDIELKLFCNRYISFNTSETLTSISFLQCDRNILANILKLYCISCTETEMFEACLNWFKKNSGQKNLTQELIHDKYADLFHEIRFGSISIGEFAALDRLYGHLFTIDELREIIQMIVSKDFQPSIFNRNRRQIIKTIARGGHVLISCDRRISEDFKNPYYIQSVETTVFSVNKSLFLGALICEDLSIYQYWEFNGLDNVLSTDITITKIDPKHSRKLVFYSGKANFETGNLTQIKLSKPILIEPEYRYEIRMEQSPPPGCCYISYPLKKEVKFDDDYIATFHDDDASTKEEGDVMRGLIRELKFIKASE